MYFYLGLMLFGLLYAFDGHTIIKETAITKYRKFRQLNKLVSTHYKTVGSILWVSICMVVKMYWINFLQWSNNTIEIVDSKTVCISYVLQGKLYKMIVKIRKGPSDILLVTDEDSNDITDTILPYLGPQQDWHKREFKPLFWEKKMLNFELASGEQISFSENDVIKI